MAREIKALLDEEIAQYAARNPESRAMFERAKQSLPGGNTRTGVHIDPFPIYADYGAGTYLYDVDGRQLLDFVNNNTALPLGHAHPEIVAALQEAVARGTIAIAPDALELIRARKIAKGDPLQTARLAGIMAAKRASELIPLCHSLPLSSVDVALRLRRDGYEIEATVRTTAQTGVEMEALTAVAAAGLTIYDMVKAVDKTMVIGDIRLIRKTGGRSGTYRRRDRS